MLAGELVVGEDLRVELHGRRHAGDFELGERAAHTRDRRGAIMRGDDQLAHHRVEFRRDRVAFRDARIHADARAGRPAHRLERARAGREVRLRVLARDAQFETVAARGGRGREVSAGGDRELFAHQIESADLFAHRVLHLQTRIHFKEIRLARVGHHELARAEPHVLHRLEQTARVGVQLLFDLRVQERGGRLFDELLVAPLHGAVACGVDGELAVRVAPALRFHMTAMVDEPLHEVLGQIAALHRVVVQVEPAQLVVVAHERDAAAATAIGAFHHERIAMRVREVEQHAHVAHRMRDTRHRRHLRLGGHIARADLVAERLERARRRTDPHCAGVHHARGERRDLGKKAVAGVHGIGAASFQDGNEQILVEIRVCVCVSREQIRFVRHLHVLAVAVLLRVHHHGGDAHFARGAHHAQGNLTAVGDEQFADVLRHAS